MGKFKPTKKKKKIFRADIWLGIFIAVLMIGSTFGIMFGGFAEENQKVKYRDYTFTASQSGYRAKISGSPLTFYFVPQDVESINMTPETLSLIMSTVQLDFSSDYNSTAKREIAASQFYLSQQLQKTKNIYSRIGFTAENPYSIPVINCQDITAVPVIVYQYSNVTSISNQGNCVIVKADSEQNFYRVSDRILFGILGIIQ